MFKGKQYYYDNRIDTLKQYIDIQFKDVFAYIKDINDKLDKLQNNNKQFYDYNNKDLIIGKKVSSQHINGGFPPMIYLVVDIQFNEVYLYNYDRYMLNNKNNLVVLKLEEFNRYYVIVE